MSYINQTPKKLNTRTIKASKIKNGFRPLQMLTCYDYQTAQILEESTIDLILVGDSVGNVILGLETTLEVGLTEMKIFGAAVKRGAPNKFVIVDMPFGSYATFEKSIENAIDLFKATGAQALKIEGAADFHLDIVKRLTAIGIPVMGHIGLQPQSVHQQGGYYTHGKDEQQKQILMKEAIALEKAGAFSVVLECVEMELAAQITQSLNIPTIGIGSGEQVDGQVLVINDLLKMGKQSPPKFCKPIADLYQVRKDLINNYLGEQLH